MSRERLSSNSERERRVDSLNPVMDFLGGVAVACEEGFISREDLTEITRNVVIGSIRVDLDQLLV